MCMYAHTKYYLCFKCNITGGFSVEGHRRLPRVLVLLSERKAFDCVN